MKEEHTPDAFAVDGMISLLNDGKGSKRSVSFGSQQQLSSELLSLQYNDARLALERWLTQQIELLLEMQKFTKDKEVVYPETQLKVLDLNMKIDRRTLASNHPSHYLGQLFGYVISHSYKLRERIENTTSHVLITGDVNAGKSSLCNALLRRNVLPVDQQPCTDVFCEVIDFNQNDGVEQVHAVYVGKQYLRDDFTTYKKFPLEALEDLVHEPETYILLKIYLQDKRDQNTAILCNGIVDICLIDAPGLNVDVATTTQVFGRQEEIDLVIFVVSAENHFTQSSKEFVSNTSREKSLVFIVVNNFDKIKDQARCKTRVLNQVKDLIPETHKGAGDFVHFVNSKGPERGDGPDDGSDGGEPCPHGPGSPDFDQLESRLRNFVLEKRAFSKLAPARNYLLNTLEDILVLATKNVEHATQEQKSSQNKLEQLSPNLNNSISQCAAVCEQIDKDIEKLSHTVYTKSMEYLRTTVDQVGESPVCEYDGIFNVFNYALQTREIIIAKIQDAVHSCEESARDVTESAVQTIKNVGVLHVGEQPAFARVFQKSAMFSRRRDNLDRHIKANLSIGDFLDFSWIFEKPLPVLSASKMALMSQNTSALTSSLTIVSAIGAGQLLLSHPAIKVFTAVDWTRFKGMLVPIGILTVVGAGVLVASELPRSIPRKMARKIALEVDDLGYVGTNATRIATECRKVLKFPAQDVRSAFQSTIEKQSRERDEIQRQVNDSSESLTFFKYVLGVAEKERAEVAEMHLEFS